MNLDLESEHSRTVMVRANQARSLFSSRFIRGWPSENLRPWLAEFVRKFAGMLWEIEAALLEQRTSRPLTIYEPNALPIKLPSGGMILVNQ